MNMPNHNISAKVVKWASYGDEDLRFARHGLALSSGCPYRLIAYHAQQCAEKYLKAYLVLRQIDFPYTHNIARLLEVCSQCADWTSDVRDAEELTPFAITTRYPGEDEIVTKPEALRAIEIATRVRQAVRAILDQANIDLPPSTV